MSDTPQTQPPGWYYAQGDPPGTQRYWDGASWEGGPQPVPGSPQAASAATGGRQLAEPINRIGARLIDWVLWFAVSLVIQLVVLGSVAFNADSVDDISYGRQLLGGLLALIAIAGYETFMVGSRGATLGKMALGLTVVKADGSPLTMADAAMRIAIYAGLTLVGAIVPFLNLIFGLVLLIVTLVSLVFLFTDELKQTVWDKVAKTIVVAR